MTRVRKSRTAASSSIRTLRSAVDHNSTTLPTLSQSEKLLARITMNRKRNIVKQKFNVKNKSSSSSIIVKKNKSKAVIKISHNTGGRRRRRAAVAGCISVTTRSLSIRTLRRGGLGHARAGGDRAPANNTRTLRVDRFKKPSTSRLVQPNTTTTMRRSAPPSTVRGTRAGSTYKTKAGGFAEANGSIGSRPSYAANSRSTRPLREKPIVIDSDDEATFYTFAEEKSQHIDATPSHSNSHTKPVSKMRANQPSQSSKPASKTPNVSRSLTTPTRSRVNLRSSDTPKNTRSHETPTGSPSHIGQRQITRPLAVVCEDTSAVVRTQMAPPPPPSPFLNMRNSNVRPVGRIPISPYTKSPHSLPQSAVETPHTFQPPATRRLTRSSPQKSPTSKITTEPSTRIESAVVTSRNRSAESLPHGFSKVIGPLTPFAFPTSSTSSKGRSVRTPSPAISERRLSVRQTENIFKYKDILVKRTFSFTQVILNTTVKNQKNTLTVKALRELTAVLNNAKYDDTSHVILLTGSDNGTFCSGLDLTYLTSGDIHLAARNMSDALAGFIRAALSFPKPLVAAVNGEAVGCGVAILPLCDIVYASDKATFFTPYTQLGQVPEAGLSCSLSQIIGMALANEMLMAGRMLTALEAYQMGLVAQVFWPTSMMQEVIPRITNMASACSSRVLNATKSLIRSQQRERLLAASHTEASMLAEIWPTPECQRNMKIFLEHCC